MGTILIEENDHGATQDIHLWFRRFLERFNNKNSEKKISNLNDC